MDTKETNHLPQKAELEETLADAAIVTADNQQTESETEASEIVKTKPKRVTKAKVSKKIEESKEEASAQEPEDSKEEASTQEPEDSKEEASVQEPEKSEEKAIVQEPTAIEVSEETKETSAQHVFGTKKEIIDTFKSLVENSNADIKEKVDALKQSFYKIHKQEIENARKAYVEAGNAIETFKAEEDSLEIDFKTLLGNWREKRAERLAEQENQRKSNLEKKNQIIEAIKSLTDSTEDIGRNFNEFRRLQQSWKEVGPVPQEQVNELWKKYQVQVERFYDLLKINNEFREYDFKKNLEIKTNLCETAEKLAEETDVVIAFRQLQKLHEEWRETGPVAKDFREDIWNRFKNASSVINKNHQGFFERLKTIENDNLNQKTAICETIEAIDFTQLKSYKDWDAKTAEIISLQEQWKAIGFAPKKVNIKIFERFRTACDNFFRQKSEFYKASKDILNQNLEKKKNLCEKAEALKDSTDWKATSDILIQIQKEWKTIGSVPKKFSDSIWKRFIAACDFFFEQKEKNAPSQKNEEQRNLTNKKELIEQLESITAETPEEEAQKLLHELSTKWNSIGHVPFKEKDKIYKAWHEALDNQMERFHLDKSNRRLNNFQHNLEDMSEKSQDKVLHERERLLRQFDNLTTEIKTSENNIGFFTTSKSSGNGLLDVMKKKIEDLKEERDLIYKKIKMIDEQL
ncbi:MAG: DUF349 domain-containing protein [Bacteroidales bacterium]|nr:DUF349 domain-containing protein [Bacteroidales bacterium]